MGLAKTKIAENSRNPPLTVRLDGLGTNYLETRHRIGHYSVPCASWCCIAETTLADTVICNQAQTCVTVVNLVSFPVLSQIKPQAPIASLQSYLRNGLYLKFISPKSTPV